MSTVIDGVSPSPKGGAGAGLAPSKSATEYWDNLLLADLTYKNVQSGHSLALI